MKVQSNIIFSSLQSIILFTLICLTANTVHAAVSYAMPLKGDEHMIGNLLEWKTLEELNSEQFLVEKSIDGVNFKGIGKVVAAGDSEAEKGYRFLDINATGDLAYYRLKQIDVDGTSSLSSIAVVSRLVSNDFMITNMSSPSTNSGFTCALDVLKEGQLKYELYNAQNELVQNGDQEMYNGLNELQLTLIDEAEGIYFLRISMDAEMETITLRRILKAAEVKDNVAFKDNE